MGRTNFASIVMSEITCTSWDSYALMEEGRLILRNIARRTTEARGEVAFFFINEEISLLIKHLIFKTPT